MSNESVVKPRGGWRDAPLPALALIAVGLFFFVARLVHVNLWEYAWPVLILLPGLLMLWPAYTATSERKNRLSFLAVPGAVVTLLAGLLFVNSLTGYWRGWSYLWPLLPAAAVAGLMYARRFDVKSPIHENGRRLVRGLLLMTMGLALFFELMLFHGLGAYWPLWLVAAGIYLLIRQRR
jgi:hypothetical protein